MKKKTSLHDSCDQCFPTCINNDFSSCLSIFKWLFENIVEIIVFLKINFVFI